ncbi:MAG TPA: HD-GYP domain-containing protein, partial [Bacillota bacterium]
VLRYALYAVGISALTLLFFGRVVESRESFLLFLFLTLATESLSIHFPRTKSTMSVGFALIHAGVLLFEPVAAAWIAALGTVRQVDLMGRVPWRQVVYNRVQLAVAAFAASSVFRWFGGNLVDFAAPRTIAAGVASGVTYFVLNSLGVLIGFAVIQRLPNWASTFRAGLRWVAANWVTVLPISYLMAITFQELSFVAMLFYILPLFVARRSFQMYVDARRQYLDTIRSLAAALEAKDRYTFGHAERVARLAVEVGRQLRLSQDELEALQVAGILHDIGKIGIADAILQKTDRYTSEDFREMMKHPIIGARIVSRVEALDRVAAWIRHHHERFDGQGYPDGLRGHEIPIGARILAVVDAFDAMTSARPYSPPLSPEEALFELERCAGSQFDPQIVAVFRKVSADGTRLCEILAGAGELTEELLRDLEAEIPNDEQVRQAERATPTAFASVRYHPNYGGHRRQRGGF